MPNIFGLTQATECFWTEGSNIGQAQTYQLVVLGPDQIIYTLRITVTLDQVNWNFDDPTDPNNTQVTTLPGPCVDSTRQNLTGHVYSMISEKGPEPDGRYHVTASPVYGITATQFWFDGTNPRSLPISAVGPLVLSTPPYLQYVGQEEGVPIGT